LLGIIRNLPAYQQLILDLKDGVRWPGLGLARAARLPVLAALQQDLDMPVIFITDRSERALTMYDELGFWSSSLNRMNFPEPNPLFYELASWGSATRRDRLQALTALALYHMPGSVRLAVPPLIIAPVRAVMTRTLPRRDFIKASRTLKPGQQVPPEQLQRSWVAIGYQAAEIVLEPGQFSRRGGLLDVWPPADALPVRLDFFGDEIESIRCFDPATQRTCGSLNSQLVTPAREVLPGKAIEAGIEVQEVGEFYLPEVHPVPASLLDYLPTRSLVVLDDLGFIQTTAAEIEEQSVKIRRESIQEGILPASFPVPYLSWSELQDSMDGHPWLELGRATAPEEPQLASRFSPGPRFGGRLKTMMEFLVSTCQANDPVVVISRQASRLRELWDEQGFEKKGACSPEIHEGSLTEGWQLQLADGTNFHLVTDSEIFGWDRPKPRQHRQPAAEAPEANFSDLRPGDWVVHIDYGIGRFTGLVSRVLEGTEREFLCVEYEGGDQLYVPVYQADRLSRYIGPDAGAPALTRLGSAEWSNTKQHVREAVLVVARELLELYARRQVASGHAFKADSHWQNDLEASFPYIETVDQMRAIKEVKLDMENERPMDRLLCGDVGYGKTEVALRAAFKAVLDGKQVAVLVPTTVLAQQHFETFRQRLSAFPVEVEMLSRFRTPKEQDLILKRLATGSLDIIIGTHRLVQSDVEFKDLGLVIIDEEQRFGVTHKEHLKKLRTEVDVLTMTATPIPRTLYMALTGVRDISTINTPPEERQPIITHVGPYSPRLVRQAILRESERGGQVFFVHNRVQTIEAMASHLRKLVPEARYGIAHGQMHEAELSNVMQMFTRGEIDVLLCTSIIESGLDIPNANTLIVDRGDAFGLSQLYQLRGRVGRSAQRAYAYFFRHRRKPPTPEGMERLEVIAENTQLGAGYSIAMRDLEMRGAGEMLGTRQHGYIASVGFHLYTRLLAQAVRQLRKIQGMPESDEQRFAVQDVQMPVNVDLPLKLGIPGEYLSDQNMRLQLYRRLANIRQEEELDKLSDEFTDRFGSPPEPIQNLFYQMRIKLLAEKSGLAAVLIENNQIVLRYPPLPEGIPSRQLEPVGFNMRTGKNAYWLPMENGPLPWQDRLLDALRAMSA